MKAIDRFKNPKTVVGKYLLNVFIAVDQFFNTITAGDPDETISSRIGKNVEDGSARGGQKVIAKGLDVIDKNHCENAIERDEGKDSIKQFIKERKNERG